MQIVETRWSSYLLRSLLLRLDCNIHTQGKEGGDGELSLFSHTSSEHYSSAEDAYLTELTAYTKKQFFQVYTSITIPNIFDALQWRSTKQENFNRKTLHRQKVFSTNFVKQIRSSTNFVGAWNLYIHWTFIPSYSLHTGYIIFSLTSVCMCT